MSDNKIIKNIVRQMVNVSKGAFRLTKSVVNLREHTGDQAHRAVEVRNENLVTHREINRIQTGSENLFINAENVDSAVKNGLKKQGRYLEEVERLSESIKSGMNYAEVIRKDADEIGGLMKMILDLSSRLDVLSINAAIEAARQGASGGGFSVIAREMKKLAMETQTSAARVETFISGFNKTSLEMHQMFNLSFDNIAVTKRDAKDIYNEFIEIEKQSAAVSDNSRNIKELVASLSEQNKRRDEAVTQIIEKSESTKAQVEAVDKQSAQMHNVVDSILENVGHIRFDWHDKAFGVIADLTDEYSRKHIPLNDYLVDSINKNPFIELLYVMDEKGRQIHDNIVNPLNSEKIDQSGTGADRSSKEYFKHIASGQDRYISGMYISTATNRFCLTISAPILHQGSRCVLAADLNLESFVNQD